MFIISKSLKGHEYMYSTSYSILCKNKEQANRLAQFLNENDSTSIGKFKLKDNQVWCTHEIDEYDPTPVYRLKNTRNKISIVYNY